ncbi:MAG: hypothetical protein RCG15_03215 [Candidatus Rickettsia vulgarisii]
MNEFKAQVPYEMISEVQKGILGEKVNGVYNIPEKHLPIKKNLETKEIQTMPFRQIQSDSKVVNIKVKGKLYDLGDRFGKMFDENKS